MTTDLAADEAVSALLRAGQSAAAVVVGTRGRGELRRCCSVRWAWGSPPARSARWSWCAGGRTATARGRRRAG
ncbi:hypothetical protein NKH77_10445 [Streptomyces sp. M19]